MKIVRIPTRLSIIGGGTDYPEFFVEHSGAILGTSINRYCTLVYQEGKTAVFFDVPTRSGLATSSAYTVGLLKACTDINNVELSRIATTIEREKSGGMVGYQDQYLCAVGGFHLLRFTESGIRDTKIDAGWLEPYLMLFNTHQYRQRSGSIVKSQLDEMEQHIDSYLKLLELVEQGKKTLDEKNWQDFGLLLHESWQLKKQLSNKITTEAIDDIYSKALKAGAIGGKLLGAGGGGFMLLLAPMEKQEQIKKELNNCEYVPFKFENEGAKVIFKDKL